jgi:hypothetical protein
MSLILEALRKLEREKPDQARHTTVLLAPLAWPKSTRDRRLSIALGVILVTLVGAAGWFIIKSALQPPGPLAHSAPAPPPSPTPTVPGPPPPPTPVAPLRPTQASPPARHGAQPTAPRQGATSTGFRLTAIGDQEGVSVAVLNDRLMRVGDSLLGARIVRIGETEVELVREVDGRHFTIGF